MRSGFSTSFLRGIGIQSGKILLLQAMLLLVIIGMPWTFLAKRYLWIDITGHGCLREFHSQFIPT